MELITLFIGILIFIGIFRILKFIVDAISNSNKRKCDREKLDEILRIKKVINYYDEKKLLEFIRDHFDNYEPYFENYSCKGNDRHWRSVCESSKYIVEKSFSDDEFRTSVVVIRKIDNKQLLALIK